MPRLLSLLLLLPAALYAQVTLELRSINVRWPLVDITLHAECNGAPAMDLERRYFRVRENGVEVDNFTLSCPDSNTFCPMSAVLAFDLSGSMQGVPLDEAKMAGHNFVNRMAAGVDEAAIIGFSFYAVLECAMTTDRRVLNAAINNMAAMGGTALWDAGLASLRELAHKGRNPCRAVVLLTDGMDNNSRSTAQDLIDSAKAAGIPVYTIALGQLSTAPILRDIAVKTGGRYYNPEEANNLDEIYSIISQLIKFGNANCTLTYNGACLDGGDRSVEVMLTGYCRGGDTASIAFRAPDNTGRRLPVHLGLGARRIPGGGSASIPLTWLTPLAGDVMYPFDILLRYDSTLLRLRGASLPPGSWLATPPDLMPVADGVLLRSSGTYTVSGAGDLVLLDFEAVNPADTTCTPVELLRCWFSEGCMQPRLQSVDLCIIPCRLAPRIVAADPAVLCAGGQLLLTTDSGAFTYDWYRDGVSEGGGSHRHIVTRPGSYEVSITDTSGCTARSTPVAVTMEGGVALALSAPSPLYFEAGDAVRVPVVIDPPLQPGRTFSITWHVAWDPSLLTWGGLEAPSPSWITRHTEDAQPGGVTLSTDGLVTDTLRTLYTLRFTMPASPHAARVTRLLFDSSARIALRCMTSAMVENPELLLDGACRRLVQRPAGATARVFPNPVGDEADIVLSLPEAQRVTVRIVTLVGTEIARPADGKFDKGEHHIRLSTSLIPPGAYQVQVMAEQGVQCVSMVVLR
jgi:VWFA-related protein